MRLRPAVVEQGGGFDAGLYRFYTFVVGGVGSRIVKRDEGELAGLVVEQGGPVGGVMVMGLPSILSMMTPGVIWVPSMSKGPPAMTSFTRSPILFAAEIIEEAQGGRLVSVGEVPGAKRPPVWLPFSSPRNSLRSTWKS